VGTRLGGHIRQRARKKLGTKAALVEQGRKKRENKLEHEAEEGPSSCSDDNQTGQTLQEEVGKELLRGSDAEVSSEEAERGKLSGNRYPLIYLG